MPSNRKQELKATIYDKRGRILSVAFNSYLKSHPKMAEFARRVGLDHKQYLHAEIAALIKCKRGVPYKIKIERYDKRGNPKLAAPCPVCQLAIMESGIKFIEYTVG